MVPLYLSLGHIACGLEELVEDETLVAVTTLLAVNAVLTGNLVQRCLSKTVRAVFDEELLLMTIPIEVVLNAAQDKGFRLTMVECMLRTFFDAGLIWHFGILIASLCDFVKGCDDPVCQTSVNIEIALGLGQTKMMVSPADSREGIASGYLPVFRWTLGGYVTY